MADDGHRISISEERLRLALSEMQVLQKLALTEMELRLKAYMDDLGKTKADRADFVIVQAKVDSLDRGDFTPVHVRALEAFIDSHLEQAADKGWTARERRLGVMAVCLTIVSIIIGIYFAQRGAPTSAGGAQTAYMHMEVPHV